MYSSAVRGVRARKMNLINVTWTKERPRASIMEARGRNVGGSAATRR